MCVCVYMCTCQRCDGVCVCVYTCVHVKGVIVVGVVVMMMVVVMMPIMPMMPMPSNTSTHRTAAPPPSPAGETPQFQARDPKETEVQAGVRACDG